MVSLLRAEREMWRATTGLGREERTPGELEERRRRRAAAAGSRGLTPQPASSTRLPPFPAPPDASVRLRKPPLTGRKRTRPPPRYLPSTRRPPINKSLACRLLVSQLDRQPKRRLYPVTFIFLVRPSPPRCPPRRRGGQRADLNRDCLPLPALPCHSSRLPSATRRLSP